MEAHTISTQLRSGHGKGNSRQLRREGLIPAVFYGPTSSTTSLQLSPKDLTTALSTKHGRNQLIKLDIGGKEELAIVKELQVNPVTRAPLHVDFYSVKLDSTVTRNVPLLTTGRAKGVLAGGELRAFFREVPVSGPPTSIPASIVVKVGEMDMGAAVTVADVELEGGATIAMAGDRKLVAVVASRRRIAEAEEEAAKGEGADAKAAPKAAPKA